jgi:UDP-glucose 4-epimerase
VRAIVTGGAGFIGSHVVDALLARGDDVWIVDNLATGSRENVADGAELHVADIRTDAGFVFVRTQPDVCFHLAAQADVNTSVARPDFDAEVNVLATLRILEAARSTGAKVVFTSTGGAIYGECDGPATESQERLPISPYGISKLAGEEYLLGWNRLHGTSHVGLRLANVYGPRQESTLEGGVIAIFLDRMAAGEPIQIFGDGEQTRDFIHVRDVVAAALAAVDHSGGIFNVGTGVETSINELFATCRRVSGYERDADYLPARAGDILRSAVDPARAREELGWSPKRTLEDGLRETWEWVRSVTR